MELGLENKVVAIAGASKGTGRATTIRMAREGARVAYCSRSIDTLREIEKEITGFGGTCLPIECDLSERAAAQDFVDETVRAFGGLDVAVFTPSLHRSREFLDLTDDEWDETYNITFHAAVRLTRAAIPHMQARHWGRIVLVGAGSVYKQSVGIGISHGDVHPDFTTAKAALTNLSKFLSKNFGVDNIFVNCVHPAFVFPTERIALFAAWATQEGLSEQESFLKMAADVGYTPALGQPAPPTIAPTSSPSFARRQTATSPASRSPSTGADSTSADSGLAPGIGERRRSGRPPLRRDQLKYGINGPYMTGTDRSRLLEWFRRVDAGPFHTIATGERMLWPQIEEHSFLAAAAAVTERVKVMSNIMIVPMHPPVLLAKRIASIDVISGGRFILGVVSGAGRKTSRPPTPPSKIAGNGPTTPSP